MYHCMTELGLLEKERGREVRIEREKGREGIYLPELGLEDLRRGLDRENLAFEKVNSAERRGSDRENDRDGWMDGRTN